MRTALRPRGHFILAAALQQVAVALRVEVSEVVRQLREGDGRSHADIRVAIARLVDAALHPGHPELRAIRLFGSSCDAEAKVGSDIDLVVHVTDKSAAVLSTLDALDREISRAFRQLVDGLPPGFRLFDIHVVDDSDVRARRGYSSVLTSVHAPGLRLRPALA